VRDFSRTERDRRRAQLSGRQGRATKERRVEKRWVERPDRHEEKEAKEEKLEELAGIKKVYFSLSAQSSLQTASSMLDARPLVLCSTHKRSGCSRNLIKEWTSQADVMVEHRRMSV